MNSEKVVSLVIPLFNEEELVDTLSERVTGAIEDSGSNFEVVLVDDGSKDSTYQKLLEWQEKDDRVVIVQLSRNWGHQNAFNAGLDVAISSADIFLRF